MSSKQGTFGDDIAHNRGLTPEQRQEEEDLIKEIERQRKARREAESEQATQDGSNPPERAVGTADDLEDAERAKRVAEAQEARQSKEKPAGAKEKAAEQSETPDGNKSLTIEERLDLMDKELELRDLKLQRMEQKAQKWETLAQRRAGELNHLRQSSSRVQDETAEEEDLWAELRDEKPANTEQRSTVNLTEFEEEALAQARANAQMKFLNEYAEELYVGEGDERKLDPDFLDILKEVRDDYADDIASHSPKRIRKGTEAALKEARLMLKERKLESSLSEARKRRAVVSQKARERKLASQASESSSSTSQEQDTRSFEDLSADEMAERFRKERKHSIYF